MGLAGLLVGTEINELGSKLASYLYKKNKDDLASEINRFFEVNDSSDLGFAGELLIGRKQLGFAPELVKYSWGSTKRIYLGSIGKESSAINRRLFSLNATDWKKIKYTMFEAQVEDRCSFNPCLAGIGISSLTDKGLEIIEYNPNFLKSSDYLR